ncbi:hypothetical protein F5888DRAFT_1632262 [Russula emetica]|nr:hypothetical protein F5888DRAFT_1632262 [Russula emetica]
MASQFEHGPPPPHSSKQRSLHALPNQYGSSMLVHTSLLMRVPGSRSGSKSLTTAGSFWKAQWNSIRAHLIAFGGALIGSNGLAAIMHRVLGRNMSWFASKHSTLLLYGQAVLTVLIPDVVRSEHDRNVVTALLLMQLGGVIALRLLGIGSAYFLFVSAVPLFGALSLDTLLNHDGFLVSLWMYVLGIFMPLLSAIGMLV